MTITKPDDLMKAGDAPDDSERVLTGGGRTAVTRRGDIVFRDAGPWSVTVHRFLKHLESLGFGGAPRVVGSGFDEIGRETLTYITGEFVHPGPWNDAAMDTIGRMLKQLHEANASFPVPESAVWREWFGRDLGGPRQVIGHCDAAPWNIVARNGVPVALIDWEVAGPVDPVIELAQACWLNAQLYDDDVAAMVGLASVTDRARQVRLTLDGYELPRAERSGFVDKMIEFAVFDAAEQAIEVNVTPESPGPDPLWGIAYRTRSAAWMLRHRVIIQRALS